MIRGDEATEAGREVMAAARRWLAATERGDADELDRLLAEGYTYTHASTGVADSREEWLESFRSGGRRYHVYAIDDLSLRSFPGTVVMTGRAHQEMSPRGERIELNTRFTSVWVKHDDGWRLAAWQATRLTPTS
jgi:ketosteroid isomerase-like protein